MAIKAKFKVDSVTNHAESNGGGQSISLFPVTSGSEENKSFAKYTPTGKIELRVTNPAARDFFKPGKAYYIDFTEADEA